MPPTKEIAPMTKSALIKRRTAITRRLSELSLDGWRLAVPGDYQPLEAELRKIELALKNRKEVFA